MHARSYIELIAIGFHIYLPNTVDARNKKNNNNNHSTNSMNRAFYNIITFIPLSCRNAAMCLQRFHCPRKHQKDMNVCKNNTLSYAHFSFLKISLRNSKSTQFSIGQIYFTFVSWQYEIMTLMCHCHCHTAIATVKCSLCHFFSTFIQVTNLYL